MYKNIALIILTVFLFSGCAKVQMAPIQKSEVAKKFSPPSEGKSGLYIYRSRGFGGNSLKKDIWIDEKCIGETAPNVFFYEEVVGDKEYKISTESEFSPNNLLIKVKSGMLYFIRQYIKAGVFIGGAGLEIVDEIKGKKAVKNLNMAKKGTCSK